jgi:ABC-2 type transport system permease protein
MILLSPLIAIYVLNVALLEVPDSPLTVAASLFPLTAPVTMIARMAVSDVPAWQPPLAAALQLATAVLLLRLVARMFRAQQLLPGQAFTTGRYFRVLLGR